MREGRKKKRIGGKIRGQKHKPSQIKKRTV
jgi:hypothetical protein